MQTLPLRTLGEWTLYSDRGYENPFWDVMVDAVFRSPSGRLITMPGFYDGEGPDGPGTWRVRFNPGEVGVWTYQTYAHPADPDLETRGTFEVTPAQSRGFLKSTPGEAWGFTFESREPAFLLGDTTYNLFGMAHCDADVEGFLKRRVEQGFQLLRVRLQVSPFHGPKGYSEWQTRRTWPWGGSEQAPQLDRFNLDYFRTVDRVMAMAERLGIGFEMVMEAWGFEFPFNNRAVFVPELEELWLRYLIARYDAFNCVYFWTPMNEYEYYPNGDWRYNPIADRWAMRMARWIKATAPHGHIVSIHNGPQRPPFAQRFAIDPGAIDTVMFQCWGSMGDADSWLTSGIEAQLEASLEDWQGTAILAEYGYERNPALPPNLPYHNNCTIAHTRRGAWRGAFTGHAVIHGFENSWGPWMVLGEDQPGLQHLLDMRRFFTQIVPFERLRPASELLLGVADEEPGHQPLAMATDDRQLVVVYLPVGGAVVLDFPAGTSYEASWYDLRTGVCCEAASLTLVHLDEERLNFIAPECFDTEGHPWDWVLVLRKSGGA